MDMTLAVPAFWVAIFTYLGAIDSPWLFGKTGGFYLLGRPLIAGLLVGLAFGELQVAIICAISVQILYLANANTDGKPDGDITYASYGGIALTVATIRQPWVAVILAYLVGKLFQFLLYNCQLKLNNTYNQRAEIAAKEGKLARIARFHIWQPQATAFLFRIIPMFLLIFFGTPILNWFFRISPLVISDSLAAIGWILPVIGIVTMMSRLVKVDFHLIFALVGFLAAGAFGLSIPLLFIVGFIGLIIYLVIIPKITNKSSTETVIKEQEGGV